MGTNRSSRYWLLLIFLVTVPLGCSSRETRHPGAPVAELALVHLGPKVGKPGGDGTALAASKPSPLTGNLHQANTRPHQPSSPDTIASRGTPAYQTLAPLKEAQLAPRSHAKTPSGSHEALDPYANEEPLNSPHVPPALQQKMPPPPPTSPQKVAAAPASQTVATTPVPASSPLLAPSSAPTAAVSMPAHPVAPLLTPALIVPTPVAQVDPKPRQDISPGVVAHNSGMMPATPMVVHIPPATPSPAPAPLIQPRPPEPVAGIPIPGVTPPVVPSEPNTPVVVPAGPPIITGPPLVSLSPPEVKQSAPQPVLPPTPTVVQQVPATMPSGGPVAQFGLLAGSSFSAPIASASLSPAPLAGATGLPALAAGVPAGDLRTLHRLALERHAALDTFIVRLRRREVVNGKNRPEELLLLKYRKAPWSIYLKWLAGDGVGREALCTHSRQGERLYVLPGSNDMPRLLGSNYLTFSLDHPLVRSSSRHPVTSAGFGSLIEQFGKILDAMERGECRLGTLKYLGMIKRPEYDEPVEAVVQFIAPGLEPDLPRGGQRFWYFDTSLRLPILIITQDDNRREIEYYCHDRFLFPGRLSDEEFNPDFLWRK